MIKTANVVATTAFVTLALTMPAFAQSAGGIPRGIPWTIIGIASLVACIIVAYILNFKINIAKNNEHGVTMYKGAGDYIKHLATNAGMTVLMSVWALGSLALIVIGLLI